MEKRRIVSSSRCEKNLITKKIVIFYSIFHPVWYNMKLADSLKPFVYTKRSRLLKISMLIDDVNDILVTSCSNENANIST